MGTQASPGEKMCGCKGIRTCLLCENSSTATGTSKVDEMQSGKLQYRYCDICKSAYEKISDVEHPHHKEGLPFPGIDLVENFVSATEEQELFAAINKSPWSASQSGRRKQDYGPKVNFKKKKLNTSVFTGLPDFSRILVERIRKLDILKDFIPIELCNLEYSPERGAAIEPHFDDFWLWGEKLVTLNLLSETLLTFTKDDQTDVEVCVAMPRFSLIVVYDAARYQWKHAIKREDVQSTRLAMTFRELTPEFLQGGEREHVGKELIDIALSFRGVCVGSS